MAATASARLAAWPYCRLSRALPRPLRRFGAATSHQPPTTYPLNQLNPLVACSRDCAAVPHPQVNGPGLRQVFDESARPIGWLFDPIPSAAAAHMTVGVAAAPVLCWPVIAAAGPPAPPLPFLLPAAMAPAVAGPHFAWPGPQMQPPRTEAAAGPGSMQFFHMMQHEQQGNNANSTRSAPTGTAIPFLASRQQRSSGSRRSSTQAATSSLAEATLWPPATSQATQHQDVDGSFQLSEFAASHEMTGPSIPCPYSTEGCCTSAGAQPCNALLGPYSGHGGGPILPGTPTSLQEPATSSSNQLPHGGPAVDRYRPRPMVQHQQAVQQQQHTVGQQPQRSPLNLSGWGAAIVARGALRYGRRPCRADEDWPISSSVAAAALIHAHILECTRKHVAVSSFIVAA
ncbi:hypothetical protein MRX96_045134 [Rhipicephalus microplus]